MNQRKLLTLAIIAFDIMVKDCIDDDSKGEVFHPAASSTLKFLTDMLSIHPDYDHAHQQYILNVSEISSDIKRLFLGSEVSDKDLQEMLVLQAERLRWLGTDRASEEALNVRNTGSVH